MTSALKETQAPEAFSPRDVVTGVVLFLATAAFVLWKNLHVASIWDTAWILETATRIAHGDVPYRDFPFAYAPFTFVTQAAIIRWFGAAFFHHILYAVLESAVGMLLAWRIVYRLLPVVTSRRVLALMLVLPTVFLSINGNYPQPFYDCDSCFTILLAIYLALRLESDGLPVTPSFVSGIAFVLPFVVKQSIGLLFVAGLGFIVLLAAIFRSRRYWPLLAGMAAGLALFLLSLHATVGVGSYVYWTIHYAGSRRFRGSGSFAHNMLRHFWVDACLVAAPAMVWLAQRRSKKATRLVLQNVIVLPAAWGLFRMLLPGDAYNRYVAFQSLWPLMLLLTLALALLGLKRNHTLAWLLPIPLFGALNGAMMSAGLGSVYGLWPLFAVLMAWMAKWLYLHFPDLETPALPKRFPLTASLVVASVLLAFAGAYFTINHVFLNYTDQAGETRRSTLPALRGFSAHGEYLPRFDAMVNYVNATVPASESILYVPGEDLFYFATGRHQPLPVTLFDDTVDAYTSNEIYTMAKERHVPWLILKTKVQGKWDPTPDKAHLLQLLRQDYSLTKQLDGYDVYHRR